VWGDGCCTLIDLLCFNGFVAVLLSEGGGVHVRWEELVHGYVMREKLHPHRFGEATHSVL
jgi:hypothetical protein